jgi:hypothetical protein
MNIIELAKECRFLVGEHQIGQYVTTHQLEAFATAIIENYKAGLVPVAYVEYVWVTDVDGLQSPERNLLDYDNGNCTPLYALGETK